MIIPSETVHIMATSRRRRLLRCECLEDRITPSNLLVSSIELLDGDHQPLNAAPMFGQMLRLRASGSAVGMPAAGTATVRMVVHGIPLQSTVQFGLGTSQWEAIFSGWYARQSAFSVTAVIDPDHLIPESNEADNQLITSITPSAPASAGLSGKLHQPLGRAAYKEWAITHYADVDPRPSQAQDAFGGGYTREGERGMAMRPFRMDAMDRGFPVFAAADGTVMQTADGLYDRNTQANDGGPGNFVLISHGGGWTSRYSHLAMNSLTVQPGQTVKAGQLIGHMGSSGNSTQAQLHFELHHRGLPVETLYAPNHYWQQPLAYAGNIPAFTFDSYVSTKPPPANGSDAPVKMTHFLTGQGGTVYFAVEMFNAKTASSTATMKWIIRDPNDSVVASVPFTPTELSKMSVWALSYPLATFSGIPGTWSYSFELNGEQVAVVPFHVSNLGKPVIQVSSSPGHQITPGRTTPIDFGEAHTLGLPPQRSFQIQNLGNAALNLADFKLPQGFSIVGTPPTTIPAAGSANLTIRMNNDKAGEKFGQFSFTTNDPQAPLFAFNLSGLVTGLQPLTVPMIHLNGPAVAINHKSLPRLLAPHATIGGSLPLQFNLAQLQVEIVSGRGSGDTLGVRHQGSGPGMIGVSGNTITLGGLTIGTWSGGSNGQPLNINFTSSTLTPQAVQALIRNLTIQHVETDPLRHRRYVQLTLKDPLGNTGNQPIVHVIPSGELRAPVITPMPSETVPVNTTFTRTGTFTDPYGSSWTGTVNYGDGSGLQPLTINPNSTFTLSHVYQAVGSYTIIVSIYNDQGGGGESGIALAVAPPTTILFFTVNNGAIQRSRLTTIEVHFNEPVDAAGFQQQGQISLQRTSGTGSGEVGTIVETGASGSNGRISITPAAGMTSSISLSFSNADESPITAGVEHGSLADGRWQLAIPSADFLSELNDPDLRRLFGDSNNDGTVDGQDFSAFGASFGTANPVFDFDANGEVDINDFAEFGKRFGIVL